MTSLLLNDLFWWEKSECKDVIFESYYHTTCKKSRKSRIISGNEERPKRANGRKGSKGWLEGVEGLVVEGRLGEVGGVRIKLPSRAQFMSDCLHNWSGQKVMKVKAVFYVFLSKILTRYVRSEKWVEKSSEIRVRWRTRIRSWQRTLPPYRPRIKIGLLTWGWWKRYVTIPYYVAALLM